MTAPVIANKGVAIAVMLINPTTGLGYNLTSGDANTTIAVPNMKSPLACVPIDTLTGVAYPIG